MSIPSEPPTVCVSDANCLKVERAEDGSLTLWSTRRPDQRITLDADEVPGWLRPASGDLRALVARAICNSFDAQSDDAHRSPSPMPLFAGTTSFPPPEPPCAGCFAAADAVLAAVLPAATDHGYQRAIANLRDGERYDAWVAAQPCDEDLANDEPSRQQLADYLAATAPTADTA